MRHLQFNDNYAELKDAFSVLADRGAGQTAFRLPEVFMP